MITRIHTIVAALAAMLLACTTATLTAQSRVSVRQETYALIGDSVTVKMHILMNDAKIAPRSYVTLIPVVKAGGNQRLFPAILINSRNQEKSYRRLEALGKKPRDYAMVIDAADKKAPGVYSYTASIPFEEWMRDAEFRLYEDQCRCNGPVLPMSFELLAARFEDYNKLPEPDASYRIKPAVSYIAPEAEAIKARSEVGRAYVNFEVNRWVILPDYKNNSAELGKIYAIVETVTKDPDITLTGMTIEGYASPEGTWASNLALSERRAEALKSHIRAKYGLSDKLFTSAGRGEDWAGLDTLVSRSSIAYRDQILAIVRDTDVFDGRELKLMKLAGGAPYREMLRDMFPRLRHSDYEVRYTVRAFTVEQGKQIIRTRPGNMSLNEMFLVAQTYDKGSEQFNEVFEIAARVFPDNEVANINAAASALAHGEVISAGKYLGKVAPTTRYAAEYENNTGVLLLMQGDFQGAENYLRQAAARGLGAARENLSELEAKRANMQRIEEQLRQRAELEAKRGNKTAQ